MAHGTETQKLGVATDQNARSIQPPGLTGAQVPCTTTFCSVNLSAYPNRYIHIKALDADVNYCFTPLAASTVVITDSTRTSDVVALDTEGTYRAKRLKYTEGEERVVVPEARPFLKIASVTGTCTAQVHIQ